MFNLNSTGSQGLEIRRPGRVADAGTITDIIREAVARISAERHDDERAHGHEDALYLAVLTAIAQGAPNPQALAAEAIRTQEIDFSRWTG